MPVKRITIQERQNQLREALIVVLEQHRMVLGPFEAWLTARRDALADDLLREGSDVTKQRGKAEMLNEFQTLLTEAAPPQDDEQGDDTDG